MLELNTVEISSLKFDQRGLIPVVTQDFESKEVLMLAYANIEAIKKSTETGYAHYWSRSRGTLWMKGETSGNVQKIRRILVDCDYDTLLYIITQIGNACHTGKKTCFHNKLK